MGLYIPGKGFRVLRGQGRIGFVGILQVPVELGKAQYMLVFLTEKPAFFQPADIPVGEMDILRDGYRAAIGQKNRVKGRTFLGAGMIMGQQVSETFDGEIPFQQDNIALLHLQDIKGVVVLIGHAHQFGEIPDRAEGVLIVLSIGDDLVYPGLQMEFLKIEGIIQAGIQKDFPENIFFGFIPVTGVGGGSSGLFFY